MTSAIPNPQSAISSDISNPHSAIRNFLLAPGQGAQSVGMGKAWAEQYPVAAETYRQADEALGWPLSDRCFDGPADELDRTDVAQAAIYTTSVACYRALKEAGQLGEMTAAAGLSLGEFTALHLAGAFSFLDGLRLVRLRGEAMQQAAEAADSSMVALVGADEAKARTVCEQALTDAGNPGDEVLVPANFNCPGQVVLSGSAAACERAAAAAENLGLRATPLSVAGAFHSPLMQPAADRLAEALDGVEWHAPHAPVLSNVTARPHDPADVDSIKTRLVEQLTHPVRWSDSMHYALTEMPPPPDAGPVRFIELAPGKVLSGLMRRIDRKTKVQNHAKPA